MTTDPKVETKKDTVGEMTRDELKSLIREVMMEMLWEIEQQYDVDDQLPLQSEVAAELAKSREERGPYHSLADVKKRLGLDE